MKIFSHILINNRSIRPLDKMLENNESISGGIINGYQLYWYLLIISLTHSMDDNYLELIS